MTDQERLKKYELRNIAQCDRIAILEAQNKQQADRIAELEKDLHMLQRHYDQLDHDLPNAEPVAWLARNQLAKKYIPISLEEKEKFLPHVLQLYDDWIPLYATPQTKPLSDEEILEAVSAIEHEQWMAWANQLMHTETISESRTTRWTSLMVPYAELSEEMKEHDRAWARKVIRAIEAKVRGEK